MKIEDVKSPQERRMFANSVAVLVFLALISASLEAMAGWDITEILSSMSAFLIILLFSVLRFSARSSVSGTPEKLWITALWGSIIDLIARLLPEPSTPDSAPAGPPAAGSSAAARRTAGQPAHAPLDGTPSDTLRAVDDYQPPEPIRDEGSVFPTKPTY